MFSGFFLYLLYLFYGLAFFTLGVAVNSRDTRFSHLKFARFLWLLAAFGYIHGVHEWFEVFFIFHAEDVPGHFLPYIVLLKFLFTLISFLFLFAFGQAMFALHREGKRPVHRLLPWMLGVLLLMSLAGYELSLTPDVLSVVDIRIRIFIAFPGALMAGLGFWFHATRVSRISARGAVHIQGAGVALLLYGVAAGLVPSGTLVPLLGLPIEFFRGSFAVLLLYFTMRALKVFDVERQSLIEDRLNRFAQSEKINAIGQLAAGIAHEINNPLANVQLNLELLKADLDQATDSALYQKRLVAIERNIDRASKIARELLAFSRETESPRELLSLNEVIESALFLLGARLKPYEVTCDMVDTSPIKGLFWKLEEVFVNILLNAMDATPAGGQISIRTWQDNNEVKAEVCDSGSGIPPEIQDRIFEPFFTTKEVGKGTGLGLSICYGIMAAHGGRIDVSSKPHQGTIMTLIFPAGETPDGKNHGGG